MLGLYKQQFLQTNSARYYTSHPETDKWTRGILVEKTRLSLVLGPSGSPHGFGLARARLQLNIITLTFFAFVVNTKPISAAISQPRNRRQCPTVF